MTNSSSRDNLASAIALRCLVQISSFVEVPNHKQTTNLIDLAATQSVTYCPVTPLGADALEPISKLPTPSLVQLSKCLVDASCRQAMYKPEPRCCFKLRQHLRQINCHVLSNEDPGFFRGEELFLKQEMCALSKSDIADFEILQNKRSWLCCMSAWRFSPNLDTRTYRDLSPSSYICN